MPDPNQGPEEPGWFSRPAGEPLSEAGSAPAAAFPAERPGQRGLHIWSALVAAIGLGGLLLKEPELAMFTALAGLFAVAQAADLEPHYRQLYALVSWVVPVGGAATFAGLAAAFLQLDVPGFGRGVAIAAAVVGASTCVLLLWERPAHALAEGLFRTRPVSRTVALAGRVALMGLLFCVPGQYAFRFLFNTPDGGALLDARSLWGNLFGLTLLALGAVGFLVRRNPRALLERLGLKGLRWSHLLVIVLGVVLLGGLNALCEWFERSRFPGLWESDQQVNEMLVRGLSRGETLLLGVSAGIGEELVLRGALQPRLGIGWTALLFASLHVQYSWMGMVVIALIGAVLGAIRQRASTTAAIAVHAFYDILAAIAVRMPGP